MPDICFDAVLSTIGTRTILLFPVSASSMLPSRGLALIEGTINGISLLSVVEPDGRGSHWLGIDESFSEAAGIQAGDTVKLVLKPSKNWPEPVVPEDLKNALMADPQVYSLWLDITPLARWDWIRWIRSTRNPETRSKRIEAACDKFKKGNRRPCCFNRNLCTEPELSHKGILLKP